ncbi:MAG TPA: hypothetical protein VHA37_00615, partial [Candidatus Saccharimonadales bacterium]|nr:hypothetical protein [Candidatus Saccharimonadales bacterium]
NAAQAGGGAPSATEAPAPAAVQPASVTGSPPPAGKPPGLDSQRQAPAAFAGSTGPQPPIGNQQQSQPPSGGLLSGNQPAWPQAATQSHPPSMSGPATASAPAAKPALPPAPGPAPVPAPGRAQEQTGNSSSVNNLQRLRQAQQPAAASAEPPQAMPPPPQSLSQAPQAQQPQQPQQSMPAPQGWTPLPGAPDQTRTVAANPSPGGNVNPGMSTGQWGQAQPAMQLPPDPVAGIAEAIANKVVLHTTDSSIPMPGDPNEPEEKLIG